MQTQKKFSSSSSPHGSSSLTTIEQEIRDGVTSASTLMYEPVDSSLLAANTDSFVVHYPDSKVEKTISQSTLLVSEVLGATAAKKAPIIQPGKTGPKKDVSLDALTDLLDEEYRQSQTTKMDSVRESDERQADVLALSLDLDEATVTYGKDFCTPEHLLIPTLNLVKVSKLTHPQLKLFVCTHRCIKSMREFHESLERQKPKEIAKYEEVYLTKAVIPHLEKAVGMTVSDISTADDLAYHPKAKLGEGYKVLRIFEEKGCPDIQAFQAAIGEVKYVPDHEFFNKNLQYLSIARSLVEKFPDKNIVLLALDDIHHILASALLFANTDPEWPKQVKLQAFRVITQKKQLEPAQAGGIFLLQEQIEAALRDKGFASIIELPLFIEMHFNSESNRVEYDFSSIETAFSIEQKLITDLDARLQDCQKALLDASVSSSCSSSGSLSSELENKDERELRREGLSNQEIIQYLEEALQKAQKALDAKNISLPTDSTDSLDSLSQSRSSVVTPIPLYRQRSLVNSRLSKSESCIAMHGHFSSTLKCSTPLVLGVQGKIKYANRV